jgi:sortase B
MVKSKHSYEKNNSNILLVLIIIVLYAGLVIFFWAYQNIREKNNQEQLQEIAFSDNNNLEEDDSSLDSENKIKVIYKNAKGIDFEALSSINEEVVAWIEIPILDLSTPIVQTTDNTYYLTKNFYKETNKCGCLFMDYRNETDFEDTNSVIYGHNLVSGMMFGDLKKIYDGEVGNNIRINITTKENEKKMYQVFSIYKTSPTYSLDFNNVNIETLISKSEMEFYNVPKDNEAKIITLVTCDGSGNGRLIVHGYLK